MRPVVVEVPDAKPVRMKGRKTRVVQPLSAHAFRTRLSPQLLDQPVRKDRAAASSTRTRTDASAAVGTDVCKGAPRVTPKNTTTRTDATLRVS